MLRNLRALLDLGEAMLAPAAPVGRPVHMHLELTTACEHACSVCVRASSPAPGRHMELADARAYIDAVEPRFLSLNGVGEPLLHPDWDAIARHAAERFDCSVGFATGGTALAEQADRICLSGVRLVKVSLHGATNRTVSMLSSGRDLDAVEEGTRALLRRKAELGRGPELRINYLVSDATIPEIPEAVRLAARWSVGTVWFKGAIAAGRRPGLPGDHDHETLARALGAGAAAAAELGIATNIGRWQRELLRVGDGPPENRAPPPGRCLVPWVSVYVAVDGTVLPCCNCAFHPPEGAMGRLLVDGPFSRLWRGPRFTELRSQMRGGAHKLQACRCCPEPLTSPALLDSLGHGMWPGLVPSGRGRAPGA